MKSLGLDLGDKWVGVALSDALGITCKPYTTIDISDLEVFLARVLDQEPIDVVVVGMPTTFSGTQSEQTKKIIALKEQLQGQFAVVGGREINWLGWDERLSSKRAEQLKVGQKPSAEARKQSHAIAASFILQGYLDWRGMQNSEEQQGDL